MELNIICYTLLIHFDKIIQPMCQKTSLGKFLQIKESASWINDCPLTFDFSEWLGRTVRETEKRRWLKQAGWLVSPTKVFPGFAWLFLSHIISLEKESSQGNDIKVTTPWEQVCVLYWEPMDTTEAFVVGHCSPQAEPLSPAHFPHQQNLPFRQERHF